MMQAMSALPANTMPLDEAACYRAMASHDARFDGSFFTAVTSTGIYCRPICRVRLPRAANCRFYRHAAQAEAAGFRPCLRCRPELAPRPQRWSSEDASQALAMAAARFIDTPDAWGDAELGVTAVAKHLGIGDRHLRRIFQAQFGVTPLQYVQTRRLLAAKQLLADTALPVAQVALASGFSSVRRFNATFRAHYGLNPGALRRGGDVVHAGDAPLEVRLGLRPPFDASALLQFFARRALPGVETVDVARWQVARTLVMKHRGGCVAGWVQASFEPNAHQVRVRIAPSLAGCLPQIIERLRGWLDLDADPLAIDAVLGADFPDAAGLRVPGALDGFELGVTAILGQQVSVAAARTVGARLVQAFGEPVQTPITGLDRRFPSPQVLHEASEDALGALGIVRQRQTAIRALADEVIAGRLDLHPGADVPATLAALIALPGIGEWTAQYIAMRALRWSDAFPAGDIALQKAIAATNAREAQTLSQAWKPWRSYAVLRAWQRLPPTASRRTVP